MTKLKEALQMTSREQEDVKRVLHALIKVANYSSADGPEGR
jgi:hypothetical protein